MIMKLAFLYFCVAEDHAANALQGVGPSLELPNQKVVDLSMRFELQFLIKEIYRLVRVPNNLLDSKPLQLLEILQGFLRFVYADFGNVFEHVFYVLGYGI